MLNYLLFEYKVYVQGVKDFGKYQVCDETYPRIREAEPPQPHGEVGVEDHHSSF